MDDDCSQITFVWLGTNRIRNGGNMPTSLRQELNHNQPYCCSIPKGKTEVLVVFGRPDIPSSVASAFERMGPGEALSVWSGGPKKMNGAVYVSANRLPFTTEVRIFPMAYEL